MTEIYISKLLKATFFFLFEETITFLPEHMKRCDYQRAGKKRKERGKGNKLAGADGSAPFLFISPFPHLFFILFFFSSLAPFETCFLDMNHSVRANHEQVEDVSASGVSPPRGDGGGVVETRERARRPERKQLRRAF